MCVCNWVRDRQTKWHFRHLNQSASYALLFSFFCFYGVTPLLCFKINNLYTWFISCGKTKLKYALLSSLQQLLSMRYKSLYARLPALFFALQNNIFMMLFTSWNRKQTEHANKHFTQNAALKGREEKISSRETDAYNVSICLFVSLSVPSFSRFADINRIVAISISEHNKSFFSFHCVYATSAKLMKMLSEAICWE